MNSQQQICADDGGADPVVATFDVFCAGILHDALHVFQYPLRSCDRPYESNASFMFATSGESLGQAGSNQGHGSNRKGHIGPLSRLTIHYLLDTFPHAQHFVKADPNSNAAGVDGSIASVKQLKSLGDPAKVKEEMRDFDFMDSAASRGGLQNAYPSAPTHTDTHRYHYALQSDPAPLRSDYAVGLFRDGALHITPVSSVRQFVPIVAGGSSRFDNKRPNPARAAIGSLMVEEEHCSKKPDDALTSGPIADIMLRQLRRQRSYAINVDAKSEQLIECFPRQSVESVTVAQRLISTSLNAAPGVALQPHPVSSTLGTRSPLDAYFPVDRTSTQLGDGSGGVATKRKDIVWRFSREVSLSAQVKDLLQSCQVIGLESLQRLVSAARLTTAQSVALVPLAQLLEALRPCAMQIHGVWVSKTCDTFRGQAAAMREVILLLFQQSDSGCVRRSDINKLLCGRRGPVSSVISTIRDILQSVATVTSNSPAEERLWRLRELPGDGSPAALKSYAQQFEAAFKQDAAFQAEFWAKRSQVVMSHVSALEKGTPCQKLFLTISSATPAQPGGPNTPRAGAATSAPSPSSSVPPDASAATKVREFVRRIFIEHGVINKQRAKEIIAKERDLSFPQATNQILSTVVQEEVQSFSAAAWILKSLRDPETDKYRPYIISAAQELDTFESRVVMAKAIEKLNAAAVDSGAVTHISVQSIPAPTAQRVLNEIAVYRQGEKLWHIKSGNI